MKFFSNTSNLLKSGLAIATIAIATANFSQTNAKSISSVLSVSDAGASAAVNCISTPSGSCLIASDSNGNHYVTNAEAQ